MSLKKRPLNTDYDDGGYADHRPLAGWDDFGEPVEVTPVLTDSSWNDFAAELLNPEVVQTTIGEEAGFSALTIAQGRIEQWATDNASSQTTSEPATPNGSEEQICYGMVFRASVRLRGEMMVLDEKLKSDNNCPVPGHYQMTIMKNEEQYVIIFPDGTPLGEANAQIEKALASIFEQQYQIDFEVFAPIRPIRETISRATKEKDAIVRVNINIYGPRAIVRGVGQELSNHKVYLQRPDYIKAGMAYDNPHVLKLGDFQLPLDHQIEELREVKQAENDLQQAEDFKKTISTIYSSLTRNQSLAGLEGDGRLRTKLLPHQKQALDFMAQRESGPIQEKYRLWKPSESEGRPCLRHVITNRISHLDHPETGGGILADEMGMGKTLSILALTLRTLGSAHEWVSQLKMPEVNNDRPSHKRSRATLIVASSDLMINEWKQEMEIHFDERVCDVLTTIKYHGTGRETDLEKLRNADLVLTTYHTLYSDFHRHKSPLHELEWHRLVLDEAHIIRRQSTVLYRTVDELKARCRWCLTGTPIQNRLEDIGSLFAFIKIIPFNNPSNFRKYIATPFEEGGKRREMAIEKFTRLLDSLCLRRTKDLLHLPDADDRVRHIELSSEERLQYDQTQKMMMRAAKNKVGGFDQKSTLGLFQVQLQLRILCNHGTFQQPFSWNRRKLHLQDEREAMEALQGRDGEVTCSACKSTMPLLGPGLMFRRFTEHCRHVLCSECLEESIPDPTFRETADCPLCSTLWTQPQQIPRGSHRQEDDHYFRPQGRSRKMEVLLADVQNDVWTTKSIIFSCWTHTLDLISVYLRHASIPFQRIDGECPTKKREKILYEFSNNPHLCVLIMTTGTGAVGLNLAKANRVFIVEPQWNPSVENQAIARALRLGQKQKVLVTRYVVNRTVEQDMRSLQDKKLDMAGMAWA
ncbi:hypothetical protein CC80DRAFT_491551 [Byssothecium circinans]|uniref:Uncharacterized protein n=1 Tax=Byssothecium circinans TaxID=147558 RepID=A0A6A5TYM7_9PLEO|nr:hypothetical protein CC80DRAFT_491551 [Byssothecium circinans]